MSVVMVSSWSLVQDAGDLAHESFDEAEVPAVIRTMVSRASVAWAGLRVRPRYCQ